MPVNANHVLRVFESINPIESHILHDLREIPHVEIVTVVKEQRLAMRVYLPIEEAFEWRCSFPEALRMSESMNTRCGVLQDLIDTTLTAWRNRDQEQKDTEPCPETSN